MVLPLNYFCRCFDLMTIEPSSMKSRLSKTQDGRPQSELQLTLIKEMSEQEKTSYRTGLILFA
jgi:hypothetical protein